MTEFTIRTAGRVIRVGAQYESTRNFCREYLTADEPELSVSVDAADIAAEKQRLLAAAVRQGEDPLPCTDGYAEILTVCRKLAEAMPAFGTVLFHGSAVAVDGAAYLFTAPSGTGKSTHTRLWREMLGARAVMVNDDKPFLRCGETGVTVCGSPWNGKHRLSSPISVPLKAICLLERGKENSIVPITFREAFPTLVRQCYRPMEKDALMQTMRLLGSMEHTVCFYRLACNMDPEAAAVSYGAMSRGSGYIREDEV